MIDNNIGLIDVRNGDFGAAIAEFDRAVRVLRPVIERDPKNLYRLSALAWTYDNQGNVTLKLANSSDSDHLTQLQNAKLRFELALKELRRQDSRRRPRQEAPGNSTSTSPRRTWSQPKD